MAAKPKRPRDANQLAKLIIDIATGEQSDMDPNAGKDPAAVALGRKGGLKSGNALVQKGGTAKMAELGRSGAKARWKSVNEQREASASRPPKPKRKVLSVDPEEKR